MKTIVTNVARTAMELAYQLIGMKTIKVGTHTGVYAGDPGSMSESAVKLMITDSAKLYILNGSLVYGEPGKVMPANATPLACGTIAEMKGIMAHEDFGKLLEVEFNGERVKDPTNGVFSEHADS